MKSIILIVTISALMSLTSCSCPFSNRYKAPYDERFDEHTIPWEEDWSDVNPAGVDESTKKEITKLVDKLGQIKPAYMAYELTAIARKLSDIGVPSIPFLVKGVNSTNLYRSRRCLYPLAEFKELTVHHVLTSYRRHTKSNYSTQSDRIASLLDDLYYLDKNRLKDLIDSYTNSTDEIERTCLVWRIAHPDCGNRSIIPFLLQVMEKDPSRIVYLQTRNSLLCLTGLFLSETDEGSAIQQEILNTDTAGEILCDSIGTVSKARGVVINKSWEWRVGEQEARPRIVQKWRNWYDSHRNLSTTQWLKDAFDIYTAEIDGTILDPKVTHDYYRSYDIRHQMMKDISDYNNNKYDDLLPYGGDHNGSAYRKWWKTYGDKIDFIRAMREDSINYVQVEDKYSYFMLFTPRIYYLYLLCDPRGLTLLIENIKGLQKHRKYSLVFNSNCRAAKLAEEIFYDVNPTFDALKDLTGQDFGWDWRKTKEEKVKVIEQWEKWVNENVNYLYWSDEANQFIVDQEAKAAGVPTDQYRKTHLWPKEKEPDKTDGK